MVVEELREILNNLTDLRTEGAFVELKRAASGLPRRLWETISSFSNSPGGGLIILGVDEADGFDVVGVDDPKKAQDDLASLCDQMEPPVRPLIQAHQVEGKVVITAEIPEVSLEYKPCYYKGAGLPNGAFVRVADGDRHLTSYEVQMMLASRGQPREDEAAVAGSGEQDLDPELVQLYLKRLRADEGGPFRAISDLDALKTTRVLVEHDGRWVPSLAGLLALGRYPQSLFPSLGMTFVVYPTPRIGERGPGGERFLDNRRFEGPISHMILKATDALKRNMKRRSIVRGLFREDIWEYPEETLREALVNAFAHRDYSPHSRATPVQVQMFPDRLVIMNPGGLYGPVTVDRLGESGVSATRNQTLMRVLEDLPIPGENRTLCENRGSGIGTMLSSLRAVGMKPPEFDNEVAVFRVTFPNHTLLDEASLRWLESIGGASLSDNQRWALAYLRQKGEISNPEYRRLTGQDSREVSRDLRHLVHQGLLKQVGTGRWTVYRLPAQEPLQRAVVPKSDLIRENQILALLSRREDSLSNREIASELGITKDGAMDWINALIRKGLVEAIGPTHSRDRRYRLARSGIEK